MSIKWIACLTSCFGPDRFGRVLLRRGDRHEMFSATLLISSPKGHSLIFLTIQNHASPSPRPPRRSLRWFGTLGASRRPRYARRISGPCADERYKQAPGGPRSWIYMKTDAHELREYFCNRLQVTSQLYKPYQSDYHSNYVSLNEPSHGFPSFRPKPQGR